MSTNNEIKIKKLLDLHVPGTILLASWLEANGFSRDLQHRYKRSGWLESVGVGAFKRSNEGIGWQGALYSLQKQANLPVSVGGPTALSITGFSHYIRTGTETVYLFSSLNIQLPAWFKKYPWNESISHVRSSFLPEDLGITEHQLGQFPVTVSSTERAIFECLYLAPEKMDILEVYQIMSGLVNLRPGLLQKLLEECTSVKIKRLFLYMAKKANHQWFQFLNSSLVDLGQGDRGIVKNGSYDSEYQITIPKELAQL
ncbi:MAG: type IV toxin-antitoxin system AbiEi family antitoxin [Mangrovibacterium sp.]